MEQSSFMIAEQCSLSFDSDHIDDERDEGKACARSRQIHSALPVCPHQGIPSTIDKKCIALNDSPERENSYNAACPSPPKIPVKVRHYVVKNLNGSNVGTDAALDSKDGKNSELSCCSNENMKDQCHLKVHQREPSWTEHQSSPINHPPPRECMLLRAPQNVPGSPEYGDSKPTGIRVEEESETICPLYDQTQNGNIRKKGLLTSTGGRKQLDGFGSEDLNSREPAYRNLMGSSVRFGHKTYNKVAGICKDEPQSTTDSDEPEHYTDDVIYTKFLALPSHEAKESCSTSQKSKTKELSVAARMRQKYQQFTGQSLESASHDSEDFHLDAESNLNELKLSLNNDDDSATQQRSKNANDVSVVNSLRLMVKRSQRAGVLSNAAIRDDLNRSNDNANGIEYDLYSHDLALTVTSSVAPRAVDVDEVAISNIFERDSDTGHVHVHLPKDDVRLVMAPNLEPGILCSILGSEEDYELYHQILRTSSTESSGSSDDG